MLFFSDLRPIKGQLVSQWFHTENMNDYSIKNPNKNGTLGKCETR